MQVEYFLLNAILPQTQLIFHPCNGLFLCGPSAGVSLEGLQWEQVSLDTFHSPCRHLSVDPLNGLSLFSQPYPHFSPKKINIVLDPIE